MKENFQNFSKIQKHILCPVPVHCFIELEFNDPNIERVMENASCSVSAK